MATRTVKVIEPVGLHARPAAIFVMTASKYRDNDIKIMFEDKNLDAKSILNVMASAIKCNEEFVLEVTGTDDEGVIDKIVTSLTNQKIIELV